MHFFDFLLRIPSLFLVVLISLYQKIFSPDHGLLSLCFPYGFCRHYPSCSEYSKEAFEKYGFFRGLVLSGMRILKCNPWSRGGVDALK